MKKVKAACITEELQMQMFQYQLDTGKTDKEVADHFGYSDSCVSRALWRQLQIYKKKKRNESFPKVDEFEMF